MPKNPRFYFDVTPGSSTEWSRSVNLMCFLLQGISYNRLYDSRINRTLTEGNVFDQLQLNAEALPDPLNVDINGNKYPVRDVLSAAFREIAGKIEEYNQTPDKRPIKLRQLLTVKRVHNPPSEYQKVRNFIVDRLEEVRTADGRMDHFCTPFVGLQLGRAQWPDDASGKCADFLEILGFKNMVDFYTTHGTQAERMAVKRAREAGFLSEKRPPRNPGTPVRKDGTITAFGAGGNYKWCCNGKCKPAPRQDYWCLEVTTNGTTACALGSDIDPDCDLVKKVKEKTSK